MKHDSTERPRILLAEDEQIVALDVESELDSLGYNVVGIATTGPEALKLARQTRPDLVLMDIQLHGPMDGIAVADEIRRCWQIPVVFVTAYANQEVLSRAKVAGPYGYLTKPFRTKELNATITVALHQHRLIGEIFVQHRWLHTLLAGMNDGVIATDTGGQVRYLNPRAESLTGWTLPEAINRPIEEVYPLLSEAGERIERCQLRRVLADGQPVGRQRFVLPTREGARITVEDSAAPIRDAQDRLTGAVTVIVDVTEQQRAEAERERLMTELERSNAELARFSHAVSHDLEAPVRTVKSFAQLLSRRLGSGESSETAELLAHISTAADSMHRLIESLLFHAQVGHGEIKRKMVSAAAVVEDIRILLAPLLAETAGQIEAGPLPVVPVDRVQFQQLLQNLITNSLRYAQPGVPPHIRISGETLQEGWQFAVSDNGEGIPAERLTCIFDPLHRLHGNEIPGTGIGLAICRSIVERHGGRIWAESGGTGRGTTMRFLIA